jgi:hypothetical protein
VGNTKDGVFFFYRWDSFLWKFGLAVCNQTACSVQRTKLDDSGLGMYSSASEAAWYNSWAVLQARGDESNGVAGLYAFNGTDLFA